MKELLRTGLIWAVMLFALLVIHCVWSTQESRVFNKLTGANTTWMDAIFVQLRVVEPAQLRPKLQHDQRSKLSEP